jgi:hypothetical protein
MSTGEQIDRAASLEVEFEGANLGDARLSERLGKIARALAKRPDESFPNAVGSDAALEATYRFLGNERVSPGAILRPHLRRTYERCRQQNRVLAVFDTTELRFGGERKELGYLSHQNGRGLFAHVGLAISADGRKEPLGVLHLETVTRTHKKKLRPSPAQDSERLRWDRGAEAVYKELPEAICVMDREADVFALVLALAARGQQFVIRAIQNRNTDDGLLWEALEETQLASTRVVAVTERRARKRKSESKRHPARSSHSATLELRARDVVLHSPKRRASDPFTSLTLHLVHVIERDPPAGDEAIEWILLTNLSIASARDVEFIVDAYCARWVIEEFFKSLKSGCAFEKRQLESVATVSNALAVMLPIAWLLLRLRNLSRDEPDRPSSSLISPLMLHCLRVLHQKRRGRALPEELTCKQLVWAIAGLGGHITNNGEPGVLVLGRGLEELLKATEIIQAFGIAEM